MLEVELMNVAVEIKHRWFDGLDFLVRMNITLPKYLKQGGDSSLSSAQI